MKHGLKHEPALASRQAWNHYRRMERCSAAPGSLKHSPPHRERSLENLLKRTAPPDAAAHRLALDRTLAARLGRRLRRLMQRLHGFWSSFILSIGEFTPLSSHFGTRFPSAAPPPRKAKQPGRDANT